MSGATLLLVAQNRLGEQMNAIETMMARRSIRRFKPEAIPADDLNAILEAGRQAPSAANRQPWHYVVVSDSAQKQRVAQACNGQMWMADAACIMVACGLPQVSAKWYPVDVGISLENMVLAAYSLGYGTCWIGAFEPQDVRPRLRHPRRRHGGGLHAAGRA